jgi:hypothetical protein
MHKSPPATAAIFLRLSSVLGGQCPQALQECTAANQFEPLFDLARKLDLLPALSVRCNELHVGAEILGQHRSDALRQALMDNTLRNMAISAQALKFTRQLNRAGITPLFLKGTARLLASAPESVGFRTQADIDLIVQPNELRAAGDVLLADGYSYCEFAGNSDVARTNSCDTASAIKQSASHHHLPPLVKPGYAASVELHRHFLDGRFQRNNPLEPLFDSARLLEWHGVTFKVPSTEFQIIHMVLGKFVYDGYLARRAFPIRDACDLIELLENAEGDIDQQLVLRHCGRSFPLFHTLVCELMNYSPRTGVILFEDTTRFTWLMQKRFESNTARKLLDAYARFEYLAHALASSPAKLPAYLRRRYPLGHA